MPFPFLESPAPEKTRTSRRIVYAQPHSPTLHSTDMTASKLPHTRRLFPPSLYVRLSLGVGLVFVVAGIAKLRRPTWAGQEFAWLPRGKVATWVAFALGLVSLFTAACAPAATTLEVRGVAGVDTSRTDTAERWQAIPLLVEQLDPSLDSSWDVRADSRLSIRFAGWQDCGNGCMLGFPLGSIDARPLVKAVDSVRRSDYRPMLAIRLQSGVPPDSAACFPIHYAIVTNQSGVYRLVASAARDDESLSYFRFAPGSQPPERCPVTTDGVSVKFDVKALPLNSDRVDRAN